MGDQLRSLLVDLHLHDSDDPVGRIEVRAHEHGSYVIRSDGRVWDDAVAEPDVPDEVVRMLLLAALDAEESLVHIHAGAVVLGG